jgi:hypothetical protein
MTVLGEIVLLFGRRGGAKATSGNNNNNNNRKNKRRGSATSRNAAAAAATGKMPLELDPREEGARGGGEPLEPAKREVLLLGVIDVLEVLAWQPPDSCQDR